MTEEGPEESQAQGGGTQGQVSGGPEGLEGRPLLGREGNAGDEASLPRADMLERADMFDVASEGRNLQVGGFHQETDFHSKRRRALTSRAAGNGEGRPFSGLGVWVGCTTF